LIAVGNEGRLESYPEVLPVLADPADVPGLALDVPRSRRLVLDLVQELRPTESSAYTERETPIFTCVAMSIGRSLDAPDGQAVTAAEPLVTS